MRAEQSQISLVNSLASNLFELAKSKSDKSCCDWNHQRLKVCADVKNVDFSIIRNKKNISINYVEKENYSRMLKDENSSFQSLVPTDNLNLGPVQSKDFVAKIESLSDLHRPKQCFVYI